MNRVLNRIFPFFLAFLTFFSAASAQTAESLEVAEDDGLPVLIKHLPDWQSVRSTAVFTNTSADLKRVVSGKPVLDVVEFSGGTEAVTAVYPAGRLLIIEFTSPQGSADADSKVLAYAAAKPDPSTVYRRVGNYNVFVFDAPDEAAAISLIDAVKYEKAVQWLGEDPFLLKKFERYFATTTRDIFIATVTWIVGGLSLAAVCGLIAGFIFFRIREQQKATRTAYSDAGGLTRLNLDGLSE